MESSLSSLLEPHHFSNNLSSRTLNPLLNRRNLNLGFRTNSAVSVTVSSSASKPEPAATAYFSLDLSPTLKTSQSLLGSSSMAASSSLISFHFCPPPPPPIRKPTILSLHKIPSPSPNLRPQKRALLPCPPCLNKLLPALENVLAPS